MYVGLKQPRGDEERCMTSARVAAKETTRSVSDICRLQTADWLQIALINSI